MVLLALPYRTLERIDELNWKRGFFRVWLVLSIVWIGWFSLAWYADFDSRRQALAEFDAKFPAAALEKYEGKPPAPDWAKDDPAPDWYKPDHAPKKGLFDNVPRDPSFRTATEWLQLIFMLPTGLFLFGATIAWIIAGFRRRRA